MKALLPILISLFILSSCATLLNERIQRIRIRSSDPVTFVVNNDTVAKNTVNTEVQLPRTKERLELKAFNDTLSKSIKDRARVSGNVHLNWIAPWGWLGIVADAFSNKFYTYRPYYYFNMRTNAQDKVYLFDTTYSWRRNIVKFSPLKLAGIFRPSLEYSYERRTNPHFSTELTGAFIFPSVFYNEEEQSNTLGGRIGIQQRYYYYSSTQGPYFGVDISHMRYNYDDKGEFYDKATFSDTTHYYYEGVQSDFRVAVRQLDITARFGFQKVYKSGFCFDVFLGIGPKYRDTRIIDGPAEKTYFEEIYLRPGMSSKPGITWSVAVPFNFKLGWAF